MICIGACTCRNVPSLKVKILVSSIHVYDEDIQSVNDLNVLLNIRLDKSRRNSKHSVVYSNYEIQNISHYIGRTMIILNCYKYSKQKNL